MIYSSRRPDRRSPPKYYKMYTFQTDTDHTQKSSQVEIKYTSRSTSTIYMLIELVNAIKIDFFSILFILSLEFPPFPTLLLFALSVHTFLFMTTWRRQRSVFFTLGRVTS